MIKSIILGALLLVGVALGQESRQITFPDSTASSDSVLIPAGMYAVGIYPLDSLHIDTVATSLKFQISFGVPATRTWYNIGNNPDSSSYSVAFGDSTFYVPLNKDIFSGLTSGSSAGTQVWIKAITTTLLDGIRHYIIRFKPF